MRSIKVFIVCSLLLLTSFFSFVNVKAIEEVEVLNFENLKNEILKGGEKVIVIKNDIYFTEQLVLPEKSNITLKDDGSVRRLILGQEMTTESTSSYGKGLIHVSDGAKLTLDATANENLVFDGNKDGISINLDVSDNGLFLTSSKENSLIIINHASFVNSKNRGGKTAPILAKDSSKIIINDVVIKDNLYNHNETIGNHQFRDWDNPTNTAWSAKGSAIAIQGGAEVIFNNGTIEHNGILDDPKAFSEENLAREIPDHNSEQGAISLFGQGSKITINDGVFKNNSGGLGAVLTVISGAEAIVNGGVFEDNRAILRGGVITSYSSVYNVQNGNPSLNDGSVISKVSVNDGTFKNNKAYKMGGGAIFSDWNTQLDINDGRFENNYGLHGGAVVIGDRWRSGTEDGGSELYEIAKGAGFTNYDKQWIWRSKANINGGEFIKNHADLSGGAIYINSSDVNINAARFEENDSLRFGGAIYLSSVPHKLHLKNAYFENNQAENVGVENIAYNHDNQEVNLYNGIGAAIWYCPTGDSEFYVSNSAAFAENKALRAGDDFSSVTKLTKENAENSSDPDVKGHDFKVSLENRMLGGGLVKWYKDGSSDGKNSRYSSGDQPLENISDVKEELLLKAISLQGAKEAAKASAKVIFVNNKSARGGAVATNGSVIIGDKDKKFDLKVVKKWDEKLSEIKDNENTKVTIELYNATDENNEYLIDELVLDKNNNYQAIFKNLPLEAGNEKIVYKVKEKEDVYKVTYENNQLDTKNISNGQEVVVNILNELKDIPIKPNNPIKPNPPKKETQLPNTGEETKLFGLTLIVGCLGMVLLAKKK